MSTTDISNLPAFDARSLNSLKRAARDNSPEGIRAAAQQFEAVFLGMVLKTMRDATPQDGLFDSEQTKAYQQMLDQQLAQVLAAKGSTGLAAMIEKQLARGQATAEKPADGAASSAVPGASSAADPVPDSRFDRGTLRRTAVHVLTDGAVNADAGSSAGLSQAGEGPAAFVDKLWPHALKAAQTSGIPPHFMIAQAALETGWGKSEMSRADGRPAFNLFGIKAGKDWNGPVAETVTTEYVGGVPQKTVARFRAYGSYEEAFADYANLLKSNPRYAAAVGSQDAAGFAQGLQQAGYATDPMYAAKLQRIITGPSLRRYLTG